MGKIMSVKTKIKNLNSKVEKAKAKQMENLLTFAFLKIKNYNPSTWWETDFNQILNFFFTSLEETYSITSQELKTIYIGPLKEFSVKDIAELTYKADGKTLVERLREHWNEAAQSIQQGTPTFEVFQNLAYKFERIINTETNVIKNAVKYNRKPLTASILIIDAGCDDICQGGIFPADEDVELPPYHPNCSCDYWYEETDDPDEIADLDLEIE